MKNYLKIGILLLGISLIFTNCEKDNQLVNEELTNDYIEYEITQEDILKIVELEFNPYQLKLISKKNREGINEKYYIIEEDIMISYNQVDEMISSKKTNKQQNSKSKHYHSNNIVDNIQTLTVRGVNQGNEALSNAQQTALSGAIQKYNELNIGLDFVLTFGAEDNSLDINAIQVVGPSGGRADFPFNGNPGPIARIFTGTNGENANVLRHIWIHELGHTLGLRHTDWFSRESCPARLRGNEGVNSTEVPNANGANHIPGTPTGYDVSSVMLACFNNSVLGKFNSRDIIALEYLYALPQGASLICGTTSETYTVDNDGSSVTWQTPSYLNILSSNNTSVTVQPNSSNINGPGYVRAVTSNGAVQKDFWIGKRYVDGVNFTNSVGGSGYFCSSHTGNEYEILPKITGNTYQYRLLSFPSLNVLYTSSVSNFNTGTINYTPSPGWYVFEARITNACGTSPWGGNEVEYVDCTNGGGGGSGGGGGGGDEEEGFPG